jgi:hypothetical protein
MRSKPATSATPLWQGSKNWTPRPRRAALLLLALMLTACASQTPTLSPVAGTVSASSGPVSLRPFSCSEFDLVQPHLGKITPDGKPDISKEDVTSRLALPDWEDQLHHLFGDTSDTIGKNKLNDAVWHRLCDLPK